MTKKLDTRALALELLYAESEATVEEIIRRTPEMSDGKNWRLLDGRDTNFNITSNQASDGGKALTELMTNMVDAVLMKHALAKGIDPKGPNAPLSMYDAVDKLIKPMQGGKLINLDEKDPFLADFALKNLVIGVTGGGKTRRSGLPCYTFADNGEGQPPERFPDTFLSLSKGNKKDIRFVQGKYNMGSSGVLGYCGLRGFKLIVSRRYDRKSPWGFTLLRMRPGGGMPTAEYFVLPSGSIPSFETDVIYPFKKGDGKTYDKIMLTGGTVIKLYDYHVGKRFSGFRGSREALNENLVETILPFRILDFRWTPDAKRGGYRADGIDARSFNGMEYLLLRSHRHDEHEQDEDGEEIETDIAGTGRVHVATIKHPQLGEITISAIPLKRKLPGWLQPSATKNRVFHAVNGQVQYKQTRGFLTDCGFPALKDRVIIVVDASELLFEAHNQVWKGDREHVRETIVGEMYKDEVKKAISQSIALKDMQIQIAQEELQQAANTESNGLFQKLVNADRNLAALLTNRDPVIFLPSSGGGKKGDDDGDEEFAGKYSPTFVRIEEKAKAAGLSLPINRSRPIAARTDAENGYLQRADNRGRFRIDDASAARFSVRVQLKNGRLTTYLEPKEGELKVGQTFVITLGLQDDAMPAPVEDKITVRVVEEEKPLKTPTPPQPKPPEGGDQGDKEGEGKPKPTHGLPKYRLMTKDGRAIGGQETLAWPDDFNEYDGGTIEDLGDEGMLYKINYDNTYHLKYRMAARTDVSKDVITEKYVLGMRILMLGYEHALSQLLKKTNGDGEGAGEFTDEFRRMAARGAAATVLALAENLPKIIDKSSLENAQDVE